VEQGIAVRLSGISCEDALGKKVCECLHMSGQGQSMADILLEDIDSISWLFKRRGCII
jgi:hypothetical protein